MTTKNTCLLLSITGAQPNHRVFNIWFSKGYLSPSGYWWAHPSPSFYSYHSQPSFGKGGKDTFYKSCHSRRTDQVILPFAASTLSTQLVLAKIMLEAVDMALTTPILLTISCSSPSFLGLGCLAFCVYSSFLISLANLATLPMTFVSSVHTNPQNQTWGNLRSYIRAN